MTQDFSVRMGWAIKCALKNPNILLVISGGVTRAGLPSEAEAGAVLVPFALGARRVLLEEKSQSTRQNIIFVKALLHDEDIAVDSMVVVCIPGQLDRAKYLFHELWPELFETPGRIEFRTITIERQAPGEWLFHKLLFLLTYIDPNEKLFLPVRKLIFTGSFK